MRFMVGQGAQSSGAWLVEGDQAKSLAGLHDGLAVDLMPLVDGRVSLKAAADHDGPTEAVAAITPALPIARPSKTLCMGMNYVAHIKEGGREIPKFPAFFMRGQNSLVADQAPMILPKASEKFDYEAELMIVIGKGGRHISEADAHAAIFGYTLFNDGSLRDFQNRGPQWTPGKNFDATGAIGPIVVTPDELPAGGSGLRIQARLNGTTMQDSRTDDMLWPVASIIAQLSEFATLEPGDYVATGTPSGVGLGRNPQVWMKDGDTIEVEIEGIGVLTNPIKAE